MGVSGNKFFISELLKNSQIYTEFLGAAQRLQLCWTLGFLKWQTNPSASWASVLGGLSSTCLPHFTAQWELQWGTLAVNLVSSTEVPTSFTTLFTSLGCRQVCTFYPANMYTLLVVTFNIFTALKVLCSLQCTWLFMTFDYFPLPSL